MNLRPDDECAGPFETHRLIVAPWQEARTLSGRSLPSIVAELLTENVCRELPPSWHPMTEAAAESWVAARHELGTHLLAVDKTSHVAVGFLVHYDSGDAIRVGYVIGQAFWRRGLATELMQALLKRLSRDRRILASVTPGNLGSIRVLEKAGFVRYPEEDDDTVLGFRYQG